MTFFLAVALIHFTGSVFLTDGCFNTSLRMILVGGVGDGVTGGVNREGLT